jgi:cysteine synthase A
VRPVSIVSSQHFVNLARSKALAFGKTELVGPNPFDIETEGEEAFENAREDLVVTTDMAAEDLDLALSDNPAKQPRGLFADQFEAI